MEKSAAGPMRGSSRREWPGRRYLFASPLVRTVTGDAIVIPRLDVDGEARALRQLALEAKQPVAVRQGGQRGGRKDGGSVEHGSTPDEAGLSRAWLP